MILLVLFLDFGLVMTHQQLKLLKAKIDAFLDRLSSTSNESKMKHVPIQLAENFNQLRKEVLQASPELEGTLPSPIGKNPTFAMLGVTDSTYLDLEIYTTQLSNLISAIEC